MSKAEIYNYVLNYLEHNKFDSDSLWVRLIAEKVSNDLFSTTKILDKKQLEDYTDCCAAWCVKVDGKLHLLDGEGNIR